jgi:hypothetical protein
MVTLRVTLPVDLVESVLWLSGARTIQEAVELALLNMFLKHVSAVIAEKGRVGSYWVRARMRDVARSRRA